MENLTNFGENTIFNYQWFYSLDNKRVKQEALCQNKQELFSKKTIQEKIDYDIFLFKNLIDEIISWKITYQTQFNLNAETIERELKQISEWLLELKEKVKLLTFEILENWFKENEFKNSDRFKHNLNKIRNMWVSISLDDIPNFSSYVENYKNTKIDQVKIDLQYTRKILSLPENYAMKLIFDLIMYIKQLNIKEVVIEWIETEEDLIKIKEYIEKYNTEIPDVNILIQWYYFERPQTEIS